MSPNMSLSPARSHRIYSNDSVLSHTRLARDAYYTLARWLIILGVISVVVCVTASVGEVVIPSLRGKLYIGCSGWHIF
jgi:hypothetical protein